MNQNFTIEKVNTCKMGVTLTKEGIFVNAVLTGKSRNGMVVYEDDFENGHFIDFPEECRIGNVYQCLITDYDVTGKTYMLHEDGVPVIDPYAKAFEGHRIYGKEHVAVATDGLKACRFVSDAFDWRGDKKIGRAYEDSIYYGLHVRGFTKDVSSKIDEAGTYAGIMRKIPYLKKLGITGVVLQPLYEFEEYTKNKLNYWGYQTGFYMAPKNAYAYTDDAVKELKTLVKQLHKNEMEVILQFYFDDKMASGEARDILSYWEQSYHIDGFHLIGNDALANKLARDPYLANTKIWCEGFAEDLVKPDTDMKQKAERRLGVFRRNYMYECRRFLKGDVGMVNSFVSRHAENPLMQGTIKFMASYDGMRMMDMVSYNDRHNEANEENNMDGDHYNCSWNCGVEGETNKKQIQQLRRKQLRNAFVMLMTSQGTPFLFMGDEYGRSSDGNNNPYGQDNKLNYMQWHLKKVQKEQLEFTIKMITMRKQYDVFRQNRPLRMMDYCSCGLPDLSYHGNEPWNPQIKSSSREIGMLFAGDYGNNPKQKNSHIFILYNMHWEKQEFALPKLMKDMEWELFLDTENVMSEDSLSDDTEKTSMGMNAEFVPGRSVRIYIAKEKKPVVKTSVKRRKSEEKK